MVLRGSFASNMQVKYVKHKIIRKEIVMKVYVESGTNKVFFSVTHKLKRFYVYTGLQTTEKFTGMVFPKTDMNAKAKTTMLARLYANAEEYLLMHSDETVGEMKEHLKEIITGAKREKGLFLDYLKEFGESRNKENTKLAYHRTYVCVSNYDSKATFDSIDKKWVVSFIERETKRGRKMNGIATDIAHLKAAFKKAIEEGKTSNYPFGSIRMKKEETKKRCLSLDQMRGFRDNKTYRNNSMVYVDAFMLGFYLIGINISDLLNLKKTDLCNGRISYYRNKTGKLYDIKVEPEAMEIIQRHRNRVGERLLDFLSYVKNDSTFYFTINMNKALRRIGERDASDHRKATQKPIEPKISSYWNRHTWATFASEIGIPMEIIGRALGHSLWDNAITATYIKFDNKAIDDANRKVIDYLNSDLG